MSNQTTLPTKTANVVPAWLIQTMQSATVSTFNRMIGETICLEPDENVGETHYDGAVGIISFVGELTWSMVFGLPHRSAETIAMKFAGFEIPFESADMIDVVGELTNVLAGVICGDLESKNIKVQMSLPTVARGKDFQTPLPEGLVSQRLHFSTLESDFWVKMIVPKHL